MNQRTWKLFARLTVIFSLVLLFWDHTIAAGFLTGSLLSAFLYFRNASYWGDVLDAGTVAGSRYGFHFLANMAIMAAPMLFAAFFPDMMNIFSAAAGLLMIKITVTLDVLLPRKGGSS